MGTSTLPSFDSFDIVATATTTVPNPGAGVYTQSNVEVNTRIVSSTPLACLAYIVDNNYYFPLPYMAPTQNYNYGGFLWIFECYTRLVNGNVYFGVNCSNFDVVSGPGAVNVRYYILQQTAR